MKKAHCYNSLQRNVRMYKNLIYLRIWSSFFLSFLSSTLIKKLSFFLGNLGGHRHLLLVLLASSPRFLLCSSTIVVDRGVGSDLGSRMVLLGLLCCGGCGNSSGNWKVPLFNSIPNCFRTPSWISASTSEHNLSQSEWRVLRRVFWSLASRFLFIRSATCSLSPTTYWLRFRRLDRTAACKQTNK